MTTWPPTAVAFSCFLVAACSTEAPYRPRWSAQLASQVCIERLEDNGSLNVRPAYVRIDSVYQAFPIFGGEAKCVSIEPGSHTIRVVSLDPYDPHSQDMTAWASPTLRFAVAAGRRADFEMCGTAGAGSNGYSTWSVAPRGTFARTTERLDNGTEVTYVAGC